MFAFICQIRYIIDIRVNSAILMNIQKMTQIHPLKQVLNPYSVSQHFTIQLVSRNPSSFNLICKQCDSCASIYADNQTKCLIQSTKPMYMHILKEHPFIATKLKQFHNFEPTQAAKLKKKILAQYEPYYLKSELGLWKNLSTNYHSDEWIDKLIVDGYPIREIIRSISIRYQDEKDALGFYFEKRSRSVKQALEYGVYFIYKKLPKVMLPSEMSPVVMEKFRVTQQAANLLIKTFSYLYMSVEELIDKFSEKTSAVRSKRNRKTQELQCLMFTQESLKQNFDKHGEIVMIYAIENRLRGKKVTTGILFGHNYSAQPTLFGFYFLIHHHSSTYEFIISSFLQEMQVENKYPRFIFEYNAQLITALHALNKTAAHEYNQLQYTIKWDNIYERTLKLITTNHKEYAKIAMNRVLNSSVSREAEFYFNELRRGGESGRTIERILVGYKDEWKCNKKPFFVGLESEKNAYVKLGEVAKRNNLKDYQTQGFFFLFAFRLCENFHKRLKLSLSFKQFQQFKIDPHEELQYLGNNLEKDIFRLLLQNIQTAELLVPIYQNDGNPELIIQFREKVRGLNKNSQNIITTVIFNLLHHHWECSCKEIYWSGIPCRHLVKVILLNEGSLQYYINSRWLDEEQFIQEPEDFYDQRDQDSQTEDMEYYDPDFVIDQDEMDTPQQDDG